LSLTHTLSNHSLTPSLPIFFFILPPPPRSTLFPYTTLFRSELQPHQRREPGLRDRVRRRPYLPDGPGADGQRAHRVRRGRDGRRDRKSTRLNSSHLGISYAVFCLKKKKKKKKTN